MSVFSDLLKSLFPQTEITAAADNVEELLGIHSLQKGILQHREGHVLILEIAPINFRLKSDEEQAYIITAFEEMLRVLKRPFQILTLALPADITDHINYMFDRGEEEPLDQIREAIISYLHFSKELSQKQAVTRRFFLALPAANPNASSAEAQRDLSEIKHRVQQSLRKCGNEFLETEDPNRPALDLLAYLLRRHHLLEGNAEPINSLSEVIPETIDDTDPMVLEVEGSLVNCLLCTDFPYRVESAWLTSLITAGEGIEISFLAHPLPQQSTVHEITRQTGFSRAKLADAPNATDSDYTAAALNHALIIRQALSEGDELWNMSLIVRVSAGTRDSLSAKTKEVEALLTTQGIRFTPAHYRHRAAWLSSLPLVQMKKELVRETKRNILRSSLCSIYPFVSFEISDPSGVMLGINEHNDSPVMLDIFNTKIYSNANMVVLGSSGSGKTFATQLLAGRFRLQGIPTMFICPLKGHEYKRLCQNLGGDYIRIAPGAQQRINILEIRLESLRNPRESALAGKLQNLRAFFSIMLPDLSFKEQQLLDELLLEAYALKGITLDNASIYDTALQEGFISTEPRLKSMPTLGDVHALVQERATNHPELREIDVKLRPYVSGSLSVFNGATNVDLSNRYIVCDVSDLPHGQAIVLGMFLILDIYRDRIQRDPSEKKCLIIDEVWRLIGSGANAMTADYVLEMYKTIRGYGGAVISATQDINDLFALEEGKYGRAMLNSAKIKLILPTEEHEARVLQPILGLSAAEMGYITHSERGHGLLYAGGNRITLHVLASSAEHQLITTDRSELAKLRKGGSI